MRGKVTNEVRRPGTSTKLNTFAVLEEEDVVATAAAAKQQKAEVAEQHQREKDRKSKAVEKLREEARQLRDVNWADIEDDSEDEDMCDAGNHAAAKPIGNDATGSEDESEDEAEAVETSPAFVLDIKKDESTKLPAPENEIDNLLAALKETKKSEKRTTNKQPAVPAATAVDEAAREKAKSELKAKMAALRGVRHGRAPAAAAATAAGSGDEAEETAGKKKNKTKREKKEQKKMYER